MSEQVDIPNEDARRACASCPPLGRRANKIRDIILTYNHRGGLNYQSTDRIPVYLLTDDEKQTLRLAGLKV